MSTHGQDPFEQQLTATLRRHGQEAGSPSVGSAGLGGVGRQERTRRRGFVAGAVAAVTVVALGVGGPMLVPDPAETPEPTAPSIHIREPEPGSPPGYLTSRPWTLHLGEDRYRLPEDEAVTYQGGVVMSGPALAWGPNQGLWRVLGDDGFEVLTARTSGQPVISADGSRAAWISQVDADTERVVLHDLQRGRRVGHLDLPLRTSSPDHEVAAVDAQGRVFVRDSFTGSTLMWGPGRDPVELTEAALGGAPSFWAWPGGLAVSVPADDGSETTRLVEVADDGALTIRGEVPAETLWSPDGARAVRPLYEVDALGDSTAVGVELTAASRSTTLPVAPDSETAIRILGWQSSETVWVQVTGEEDDSLWSCDVVAVECASAVEGLPRGTSATGPRDRIVD